MLSLPQHSWNFYVQWDVIFFFGFSALTATAGSLSWMNTPMYNNCDLKRMISHFHWNHRCCLLNSQPVTFKCNFWQSLNLQCFSLLARSLWYTGRSLQMKGLQLFIASIRFISYRSSRKVTIITAFMALLFNMSSLSR